MSKKTKKTRTKGDKIWHVILVAAIGVFIFSAAQLTGIFHEYKKGTEEYARVREYVEEPEEDTEEESNEGEEVEEKPVPPKIDWQGLQAVNPDIIGWLQIEGTEINYPVVQGTDNEYYLKHTFEQNPNSSGSIFVDYENRKDFQDCNTIIYGHNMKNGSMFGLLRRYFESVKNLPGSYIWVCTPEKNYRYEIFSSHVVDSAGEVYTLFPEADEQFAEYVASMGEQSVIDFGVDVGKEDKVITLSTCTGNEETRFVVQAKRKENIDREKRRLSYGKDREIAGNDKKNREYCFLWRCRCFHRERNTGLSECGRAVSPTMGLFTGNDFKPWLFYEKTGRILSVLSCEDAL